MDMEVILSDLNGNRIGYFSPAHERGFSKRYSEGSFCLENSFILPRITKGTFYLSIWITEPKVDVWIELKNCLKLISMGASTKSGFVYDYDKKGWLILEEKKELN